MNKTACLTPLLLAVLLSVLVACGGSKEKTFDDRGRYIYDEAGFLPQESETSLAAYLWRLDSKTDYEIVLVFPKAEMDETEIIDWFNSHGVGKKSVDNGAAIFVFPDGAVFVAIGSGNDKVSVAYSKTYGEKVFTDFQNDPVLTLLRFTSALGGKVNESSETDIGATLFEGVKTNLNLILLWAAVLALFFFLVQQLDGFQPRDFILPVVVFAVLGVFFGFSALSSNIEASRYDTYGVITSTHKDSYLWTHIHTICTSTGTGKTQTQTCTSYPHLHTMYTNDVNFLSYEFKEGKYRFSSDEFRSAWEHEVGELDKLSVSMQDAQIVWVSGLDDNSGGETIGDGVWIYAGRK